MKRIIKLNLIMLLVIMCLVGVVYAAPSCSISLETSKLEFSKNEEFNVDVKLSNIQSEIGFIALEATLEYDKNSLTLLQMEGQNSWSNPVKDLSYNEETGTIIIDKDGLAKSDEVILRLKFKVNENSKKNVMIALRNISVSDTTVPATISVVYKNITIKEGENNPIPKPPVDPTPEDPTPENPNPENPTPEKPTQPQIPSINTNTTSNGSTASGKIPQTGVNNEILIAFITIITIVGVIFYIKIKKLNKEIKY